MPFGNLGEESRSGTTSGRGTSTLDETRRPRGNRSGRTLHERFPGRAREERRHRSLSVQRTVDVFSGRGERTQRAEPRRRTAVRRMANDRESPAQSTTLPTTANGRRWRLHVPRRSQSRDHALRSAAERGENVFQGVVRCAKTTARRNLTNIEQTAGGTADGEHHR